MNNKTKEGLCGFSVNYFNNIKDKKWVLAKVVYQKPILGFCQNIVKIYISLLKTVFLLFPSIISVSDLKKKMLKTRNKLVILLYIRLNCRCSPLPITFLWYLHRSKSTFFFFLWTVSKKRFGRRKQKAGPIRKLTRTY